MNFIKQAVIEDLFSRYKIFAWHGADDANMNGVGSKLPRFFASANFSRRLTPASAKRIRRRPPGGKILTALISPGRLCFI